MACGGGGGGCGLNHVGNPVHGGAGGFGAGGGGGGPTAGSTTSVTFGGSFGGNGGVQSATTGTGGGGGGSALGGAVFIQEGGTLTVISPTPFSGTATITAGSGGAAAGGSSPGTAGVAKGTEVFLMSGGNFTLNIPSGTYSMPHALEGGGNMSGGGFTKAGAGTLDFATNNLTNTYTGSTTISGGTLQINSDNNLGAPLGSGGSGIIFMNATPVLQITTTPLTTARTVSLSGSGTIGTIQTDIATTFSTAGAFTGAGGLLKSGASTLDLTATGTNTYSGGTTLSGGTLLIADDANLGNAFGGITFTGAATLETTTTVFSFFRPIALLGVPATFQTDNSSNNTLFSGNITGSGGSLIKTGAGALLLGGTSSYTGGTTVTQGTLVGNSSSLQGAISDAAGTSVVFNQLFTGTYAGTLTGAGTLVKESFGTLILTGTSNSQPLTLVNAGTLQVDGHLTGGLITVASGAKLQGSGTLGAITVGPGGTLAPGSSIGTMTAVSLTLDATSNYENEITPTSTDLFIATTGPVVLGGTLTVIPLPGSYLQSASYVIITNPLPIATSFAQVVSANARFAFGVSYNTPAVGDVLLNLTATFPFTTLVTSSNALAAATCFDTIESNPDLLPVLDLLNFYPFMSQINDAFLQMNPSLYNGLFLSQESANLSVRQSVTNRLLDFHTSCQRSPYSNLFWTTPFGATSKQGSKGEFVGFSSAMGGFSLGADRFWDQWLGGVAATYTYDHVNWKQSQGKANVQSAYATLYASAFNERGFFNVAATGAYNHYNARRILFFPANMGVPSVTRIAKNSHNGAQALGHIDLGTVLNKPDLAFIPSVGFDAIYTHGCGYTEMGAGALDLTVQSKHEVLLRADAGFTVSRCIREMENKRFQLGLRYAYEARLDGENTTSSFVGSNCAFTVTGLHPQRHLLIPTLSLMGTFMEETLSVAANYEAEFSVSLYSSLGQNYTAQNFQLQVGYSF